MGNTITNAKGGYVVNNLHNVSPKRIKASLYKWRNSEAGSREEYALIYSSLDDESKSSLCRVSVYKDQVLCRLADNSCERRLFRFHLRVTANKDSIRGEWEFGKVTVVPNSENQVRVDDDDADFCQYHCARNHHYKVKSKRDRNNANGVKNLRCRTTWKVWHSYDIDSVTVCYCLKIHCKKKLGLCVEFDEPLRLKVPRYGRVASDLQFEYHQEVLGKPPKALTAKFEMEFEEGDEYVLFQPSNNTTDDVIQTHPGLHGPVINNPTYCTFAGINPGQQILDCRNRNNSLPPTFHQNRVPEASSQTNVTQAMEPLVNRGGTGQYIAKNFSNNSFYTCRSHFDE